MKYGLLVVLTLLVFIQEGFSQNYTVAGTAVSTSNTCFALTNSSGQAGAVWNSNLIDLNQPLDITLVFNFGDIDADTWSNPPCGADGIAFILQPLGTGISTTGGGAGFSGITPSFGVVMDTYSANPTDPSGDHISIHQNGDQLHGTVNELVPPSDAVGFPYNVEDGLDHSFRFVWTPGGTADVYFDGVHTFTYTGDIVNDIFGGDPMVYWGASASTGACWNLQTVCLEIEADFDVAEEGCANIPIQFSDISYSGTTINSYTWDFGDGTTSTEQSPSHIYTEGGIYTVELTIQNIAGLISTNSADITIYEPEVTASATSNNLCSGDAVTLTGSGAISYEWSNSVTNGVPFTPPQGTITYTVTGTDDNGCTDTESISITVNPLATPNISGNTDICAGSTSTLDAGNYSAYLWSTNATTQTITVPGGTYIVTVTDNNGCTGQDDFTVIEFQSLIPNLEFKNVQCYNDENGWASIDVSGGAAPYFYEWSNGEIGTSIDSLSPGNYSVTIQDSHSCSTTASFEITQPAAPLSVTITATDASCGNYTDGSVEITASGGTAPYHYEWSNESWLEDQLGLRAGYYSVTVTDDHYCHFVIGDSVNQPEPIHIETLGDQTICWGQTTEIGYSMITGGVPPYDVFWEHHGLAGGTIEVAPEGTTTYGAFVLDAINCISDTSYFTVTVLDSLEFSLSANKDTVCPYDTVRFLLDLRGSGGTPYEVYMNDSLLQSNLVYATPETDSVFAFTAWDACHFDSIYIEYPVYTYPLPDVMISADVTEGCQPLTVHFNEGSPDIGQRYIWDFGEGDVENLSFWKRPVHTFNNATTYHVNLTVESAEGCSRDSSVTITVYQRPDAEFEASRTNILLTDPLVEFSNYTEGGYFFEWNFGDGEISESTNAQHSFTQPGEYTVVLSAESLFSCIDTAMVNITVSSDILVHAPTAFTPNGDGTNEIYMVFITGIDIESYHMEIYNRWGEVLFASDKMDEGWDGTSNNIDSPGGIYTWYLKFNDFYGNTYTRSGNFTLLR